MGTNQGIRKMHKYDGAESDQERVGKNKFDRRIRLDEQLKDAEEEFLMRVALNELKLSETDDLIVENESESVGENDKARSLTFCVLRSRIKVRQ